MLKKISDYGAILLVVLTIAVSVVFGWVFADAFFSGASIRDWTAQEAFFYGCCVIGFSIFVGGQR